MKAKRLVWIVFLAFCPRIGSAQDFQHSYAISANGQIFIDTIGNIKIQGFKGEKVEIVAYRKGPDGNVIQIEDHSSGDVINVRARPRFSPFSPGKEPPGKEPRSKFPPGGFDGGRFDPGRFEAGRFDPGRFDVGNNSVDFEVRVPKSHDYSSFLNSFNGNIEIANVSGRISARIREGSVDVKDVRGSIRCDAFNGSIRVELGSHKDASDMKFSSMNGDIFVKAPGSLDAQVFMSSDAGRLKTDFPIKVQEMRYGHRLFAQGKLGSGRQKLTITSISGSVNLIKK